MKILPTHFLCKYPVKLVKFYFWLILINNFGSGCKLMMRMSMMCLMNQNMTLRIQMVMANDLFVYLPDIKSLC